MNYRITSLNIRLILLFTVSIIVREAIATNYTPNYASPFSESWRWRDYPELNGQGCRSMIEDKNGIMWFGVSGGVTRYDGLNWKYFPLKKDSSSIDVVSLGLAGDGSLFAGTTEGIFKFSENRWEKLNLNLQFGDSEAYYLNKIPILSSSDGSVWIGARQGVIWLKDDTYTFIRPGRTVDKILGQEISFSEKDNFDVYSIFENKKGVKWFGLRDGRIYKYHPESERWKRKDNATDYIRVKYPLIQQNEKGRVYIASSQFGGGVNLYDGIQWRNIKFKEKFSENDYYTDIITLNDGNVCIAGLGRIFIERDRQWRMYQSPEYPFASNRLILYQAADQSLWIIGLANEVWKIDLSKKHWSTLLGLQFQAEDNNGDAWYISFEGTIVRHVKSNDSWMQYDASAGIIDEPVAVLVTRDGHVWIAGSHNQISATAFFDGQRWIKQMHPVLGWGIDRRAAFEASDGSLWFGAVTDLITSRGQKGGLVRYVNIDYNHPQNNVYHYHHPSEDFSLESVYAIDQSGDGPVWVGQSRLYNYDLLSNTWLKITKPVGLDESFIDCIDVSPNGDVWIGTRTDGLFRLNNDTGQWSNFNRQNGLSSNTIINIFAESDSSIWISTDKDISHFDGYSWLSNVFSGNFKNRRDGIAIHKTSTGDFWINQNPPVWFRKARFDMELSKEHYSQFTTTKYFPDDDSPETEITLAQDEIAQPGNVLISWKGSDPWKSTPTSKLQYSYRIDKDDWSPFVEKTSEIFLAVRNGYHTFEVRARDMELNVDKTPASVSFYVVPPVWQQPWFVMLIITFLAIITFFIIYLFKRNKIISEISESKVRLFSNISHELRTPLVLILGPVTNILRSPLLDKQLLKPLERVYKNTHRLLRLVNQVLDFRKMEEGQLKFKPGKEDIIAFLREETFVFEEAASAKKIQLSFDATAPKLIMWFDFDKIEKIMFNILSNAIKYTPENGKIDVNVSEQDNDKEISFNFINRQINFQKWLKIVITDSGVGIPKRNLERIFDRFYQVDNKEQMAVGGTGIGLALAKEMAKIHHGTITVESEEDRGTSFYIYIPMIEESVLDGAIQVDETQQINQIKFKYPEKEASNTGKEKPAINGDKNKARLLLLEDNSDMQEFIGEELQKDYNISFAKDGFAGFKKAVSENPDLIISDVMMPKVDGIEFCKRIKTDERTSHIAVILLTARSSQEHKMEGLGTGADDYLTKPFFIDELRLRISNIIESRKRYREHFREAIEIEPSNIQITSVDQKFIKQAITIVEENLSDMDFDVEKFSSLIGISRVGLYNKIKALTNQTVQEFIFIIKLKRAAQLLRESGLAVSEICYDVGFKDPSHFSKQFKKQFGVSPKLYKNKHAAQPSADVP